MEVSLPSTIPHLPSLCSPSSPSRPFASDAFFPEKKNTLQFSLPKVPQQTPLFSKDVLIRKFAGYNVYIRAEKAEKLALRVEEKGFSFLFSEDISAEVTGLKYQIKALLIRVNFAFMNNAQLPNGAFLNNVTPKEAAQSSVVQRNLRYLSSADGICECNPVAFIQGGVSGGYTWLATVKQSGLLIQTKNLSASPQEFGEPTLTPPGIAVAADAGGSYLEDASAAAIEGKTSLTVARLMRETGMISPRDFSERRKLDTGSPCFSSRSQQGDRGDGIKMLATITNDGRIITTATGAKLLSVDACMWEKAETIVVMCNRIALKVAKMLMDGYLQIIADVMSIAELLLWIPERFGALPRKQTYTLDNKKEQAELFQRMSDYAKTQLSKREGKKYRDIPCCSFSHLLLKLLPSNPSALAKGPVMGFNPFYCFDPLRQYLLGLTLCNYGALQRQHGAPASDIISTFEWALRIQGCRGSCQVLFNLAAAWVQFKDFENAVKMSLRCVELGNNYLSLPLLACEMNLPAYRVFVEECATLSILAHHLLVTIAIWCDCPDIAIWQAKLALSCSVTYLGKQHALATRCSDRLDTVMKQTRQYMEYYGIHAADALVATATVAAVKKKVLESGEETTSQRQLRNSITAITNGNVTENPLVVFDSIAEAGNIIYPHPPQVDNLTSFTDYGGCDDDTPPLIPIQTVTFAHNEILPSDLINYFYAYPLTPSLQNFADGIAGISHDKLPGFKTKQGLRSRSRGRNRGRGSRYLLDKARSRLREQFRNVFNEFSRNKEKRSITNAANEKKISETQKRALEKKRQKALEAQIEEELYIDEVSISYIPLPTTNSLFLNMPLKKFPPDQLSAAAIARHAVVDFTSSTSAASIAGQSSKKRPPIGPSTGPRVVQHFPPFRVIGGGREGDLAPLLIPSPPMSGARRFPRLKSPKYENQTGGVIPPFTTEAPARSVLAYDGQTLFPRDVLKRELMDHISRRQSIRTGTAQTSEGGRVGALSLSYPTLKKVTGEQDAAFLTAMTEVSEINIDEVNRSQHAVSVIPLKDCDLYFRLQDRVYAFLDGEESKLEQERELQQSKALELEKELFQSMSLDSTVRARSPRISPVRFRSKNVGILSPQAFKMMQEGDFELRNMSTVIPDHTWAMEELWNRATVIIQGLNTILLAKKELRRRQRLAEKARLRSMAAERIYENVYNYMCCKEDRELLRKLKWEKYCNEQMTIIQAMVRVKQALTTALEKALQIRLAEALERRRQHIRKLAATLIQAVYRSYRVRVMIARQRAAVEVLQRVWRLRLVFNVVKLLVFKKRAIIREILARLNAAATKIQKWFRQYLLMKRAKEELAHRKALLKLYMDDLFEKDRLFWLRCRDIDEEEVGKLMQRIGRAFMVRRMLYENLAAHRRRINAVTIIQRTVRIFLANCRMEKQRLAMAEANAKRRRLEEEKVSAINIQKTIRMFLQLQRYYKMLKVEEQRRIAACKIQSFVRGIFAKLCWLQALRGEKSWNAILYMRRQNRLFAATKIQSVWRRYKARCLIEKYRVFVREDEPKYADLIQRAVRRYLAYKRSQNAAVLREVAFDRAQNTELRNCSVKKIQAIWRMYRVVTDPLIGRRAHRTFLAAEAVIKIQRLWRIYAQQNHKNQLVLARAHRDHQLRVAEAMHSYAMKIQSVARMFLVRNELRLAKQTQRERAVNLIQRNGRKYLCIRKIMKDTHDAATSAWETYSRHCREEAVMKINVFFRNELVKALMLKQLRGGAKISRWYKGILAKRVLRALQDAHARELKEVIGQEQENAACRIQRLWRTRRSKMQI